MDAAADLQRSQTRPTRFSTFGVWRAAVTRPNEATFRHLVEDPSATLGRAILWLSTSMGVSLLASTIIQALAASLAFGSGFTSDELSLLNPGMIGGVSLATGLLCGLPTSVVFGVLGILIFAGAIQFIAGAFGGEGRFAQMVYALAAFTAPLTILTALTGWIPIVNCLAVPIGIYALALNLLAIKSVHGLSWGAAAATVFSLLLILALLGVVIGLAVWIPIREMLIESNILQPGARVY